MIFLHPLQGSTLHELLRLYKNNKVSKRYFYKAFYIASRTVIGMPFRFLENQIYAKKFNHVKVQPPIFILGHWRSGTTLLHNTLALDPQFYYPTWANVMSPHAFVTGLQIIKFVGRMVGSVKRPIDNIQMNQDLPAEDEFILANLGCLTSYHGFYFPNNRKFYCRYTYLDKLTPAEITQWKTQMMGLYQKITFSGANKPILSKNPPNTARIKYLLELFPNAKFIHIYRNPYTVYLSTLKAFKKLINELTLQKCENIDLGEEIFYNYHQLMKTFFSQQPLIPSENFVEIKFEEFERNPIHELEKIYSTLGLSDFNLMKSKYVENFDTLKSYQKNQFSLTPELADEIYKHWHFTIDKWGYSTSAL